MEIKSLEGNWGENIFWEFYLSDEMPKQELCSAVFALVKYKEGVVLTKTHRGWEMPGGHIERGESIEEALGRELLEEVGAYINELKFIGYRKLTSKKPIPIDTHKRNFPYPFPVLYIPYYIVDTNKLIKPIGDKEEVLEAKVFSLEEIGNLEIEVKPIINICLKSI
ncbi:MAG: NUDIX domain-containing protein [Candidatus Pacebacteria bacterium]|nr:NUDIX domain-containing protein [Candidatus Paceibacterota bacterium]